MRDPGNEVVLSPVLQKKKTSPVGEVRQLVGILGYYRRYIPNLARPAKPLHELLNKPSQGVTPKNDTGRSPDKKNGTPTKWTETHQQSVNELIGYLTTPPIMAYPDYEKPFIVRTDACKDWSHCSFLAISAKMKKN